METNVEAEQAIRSQELRYWRKRVSLEEEAAVKQAGMLLSLLSSFAESFTNGIGFTTIRTQGLSDAIQGALEAGDFDLAIKSYCVSPQALHLLKNPVTSFLTSFGHVVLRTHIENVKRELQDGIAKFKQKTSTPPPSDHVTDASGATRPSFTIQSEPTPSAFPSLASLVPMLNVLRYVQQPATNTLEPTIPSTLELRM